MREPILDEALGRRFWAKVAKAPSDECWLWTAAVMKRRGGYGQINIGGRAFGAHRIALSLALGRFVKGVTCHRCDNPPCCNPNHLYEGTYKTNSQDAARQGKIGTWDRRKKNFVSPFAKLTEEKVRVIRSALKQGMAKRALAKRFGVSVTAILHICSGKNWSHVE